MREEENRPAPPSQQVIASPVTGPTPTAARRAPWRGSGAGRRPAAGAAAHPGGPRGRRASPRRSPPECPAGDRCAAAARAAPGVAVGAQRAVTQRGRAPGRRTPRSCAWAVCQPAGRGRSPAAPGVPGRATAGSSAPVAALGQQHPPCRESVLSVLACRLRPRANAGQPARPRAPRRGPASSSATYRQPVHPSSANATSPPPADRTARRAGARGRPGRGPLHLPGHRIQVVERELLPVDIQPATMVSGPPKLQRASAPHANARSKS